MKKNLLSIAIIAVLVVAMVGGTMAWFTSQAEVENVFNAGTVEINAAGNIVGEGLSLDNWNPGDTDYIKYTFVNNGSKDLRFRVGFTGRWLNEEGLTTGLSTKNVDLLGIDGKALVSKEWKWIIWPIWGHWIKDYENVDDPIGMKSASGPIQTYFEGDDWTFKTDKYLYYGGTIGEDANDGILESGESVELILEVKLDGPTTGNSYQGKSFELTAAVQAIQASHFEEEDGWDWDDDINFETGLVNEEDPV